MEISDVIFNLFYLYLAPLWGDPFEISPRSLVSEN